MAKQSPVLHYIQKNTDLLILLAKQCRIVLFLQENCVFLYLYYKLSIME